MFSPPFYGLPYCFKTSAEWSLSSRASLRPSLPGTIEKDRYLDW